jgi:hypothetical protein
MLEMGKGLHKSLLSYSSERVLSTPLRLVDIGDVTVDRGIF